MRPLTQTFGAEMTGSELLDMTKEDLVEHRLVIVRGAHYHPFELTRLAEKLAGNPVKVWTIDDELAAESEFAVPASPAVIRLSNRGLLGSVHLPWHADAGHHPTRPFPARMLSAVVIPETGSGPTSWLDLHAGWMALPQDLRDEISELTGVLVPAYETGWKGSRVKLVREVGGRRVAYFDKIFMKAIIEETGVVMDDAKGRDLIDRMAQQMVAVERIHTHHWRRGDLVIWDNRVLLHSREKITSDDLRMIHRLTFDL